jgi:hypothetical protein
VKLVGGVGCECCRCCGLCCRCCEWYEWYWWFFLKIDENPTLLQNKRNLLPLVFGFVIAINLSFTQTTRHDQIVLCSVFSDGDDGSGGGLWTELRS